MKTPSLSDLSEDDTLKDSPEAQTENEIAQANLRGSVGGVQGILAIQESAGKLQGVRQ